MESANTRLPLGLMLMTAVLSTIALCLTAAVFSCNYLMDYRYLLHHKYYYFLCLSLVRVATSYNIAVRSRYR